MFLFVGGEGAEPELKVYESMWHTITFSWRPALGWDFFESKLQCGFLFNLLKKRLLESFGWLSWDNLFVV